MQCRGGRFFSMVVSQEIQRRPLQITGAPGPANQVLDVLTGRLAERFRTDVVALDIMYPAPRKEGSEKQSTDTVHSHMISRGIRCLQPLTPVTRGLVSARFDSYFVRTSFLVSAYLPACSLQRYTPLATFRASQCAVYVPGFFTSFTSVTTSLPSIS